MFEDFWRFRRRSMKLLLRPQEFVETDKIPDGFDLDEWRQDFFWIAERKISAVKPIPMTLDEQRGDCEDFAAVAVNSMLRDGFENVSFDYYWRRGNVLPVHVTASGVQDGQNILYSNGDKWLFAPEDWADETGYARSWVREVS